MIAEFFGTTSLNGSSSELDSNRLEVDTGMRGGGDGDGEFGDGGVGEGGKNGSGGADGGDGANGGDGGAVGMLTLIFCVSAVSTSEAMNENVMMVIATMTEPHPQVTTANAALSALAMRVPYCVDLIPSLSTLRKSRLISFTPLLYRLDMHRGVDKHWMQTRAEGA